MNILIRTMVMALGLAAVTALLTGCSSDSGNLQAQSASYQLVDADGVPVTPAWVAFRDGDGPWKQLTAPDKDQVWSHRVNNTAGRYTFAVVENDNLLRLYAGTIAEVGRVSDLTMQGELPQAAFSISGAVSGVPADNAWSSAAGPRKTSLVYGSETTFEIGVRTPGTTDLLAVRTDGADPAAAKNRFWMMRDLPVAANITQGIDFNDIARADQGVAGKVTLKGGTLTTGAVSYATSSTVIANSWWKTASTADQASLPELWYLSPGAERQRPEDVQCAWGQTKAMSLTNCASAWLPLELDFTGVSGFGEVTLTKRTLTWSAYPQAQVYEIPVRPAEGLRIVVKVTPGAAGSNPSITIPDLSGVSGWKPSWTVTTDSVAPITATASGSNTSLEKMLLQRACDRYEAGYSAWTVIGVPFVQNGGFGQSTPLKAGCKICLDNCSNKIDQYNCISECDLIC